jgi:twitching motility protein PilT
MIKILDLLKLMIEENASDLYLKAGNTPIFRVDGKLTTIDDEYWQSIRLMPKDTAEIAYSIMNDSQKHRFEENKELDIAYSVSGVGRFRVNIYYQRGSIAMVFRAIPFEIPSFEELHLPEMVKELASLPRGLVIVTGATGSGKSTTLAAMIDHINSTRRVHIITIEDPIEFLHKDRESIIEQREVEMDTICFKEALKHIVRQNPDVIMVGEMRDLESLEAVLSAAETGHLVLTTMHTTDSVQTIERIINSFPPHQANQVRIQLAMTLKGIISLRLLPRADGKGRIPAVEIMITTPYIRKLIEENKLSQIRGAIASGGFYGMHTFNQSLVNLYQQDYITFEDAMEASSNPEEFRLAVRGIYAGGAELTFAETTFEY